MPAPAKVASIAALGEFRGNLLVFQAKARRSLDEASDTVRRTRLWLEQDRKLHWEMEVRRRQKVLDQTEQELLAARMKDHPEILALRQVAVRKARASLEESVKKVRTIKKWSLEFEATTGPRLKALESLRQSLDFDLPKAVALLDQTEKELEAYAELHAPVSPASESTPAS